MGRERYSHSNRREGGGFEERFEKENWRSVWLTPERREVTVCQRGATWRVVQVDVRQGGHVARQLRGDRTHRFSSGSGGGRDEAAQASSNAVLDR